MSGSEVRVQDDAGAPQGGRRDVDAAVLSGDEVGVGMRITETWPFRVVSLVTGGSAMASGMIREGDVLAVIVRDFDGARGRHVLAHAGLDQTKFKEREAKMAHPGMISSLTAGSTQTNDVFRLLYGTTEYDEVPTNVEIVQLAREALRLRGVDASKIFAEPETDKLFCQQRLHAFPLRALSSDCTTSASLPATVGATYAQNVSW